MPNLAEILADSWGLESVSDTPRLEIRWMLEDLLEKPVSYLTRHTEAELDPVLFEHLQAMLARRLTGEPLAYILGHCGFWSLDLQVSPATLIPRPETELLVELAIQFDDSKQEVAVLDLGTGTGAIALAIASERPAWQVTATDQSEHIVQVARTNAQYNQIDNVQFSVGSWYQALDSDISNAANILDERTAQRFHLIVSNPPYIEPDDHHLFQGDVRFEPRSALVAENDGLADLEYIITNAKKWLKPRGMLLVEHGYQQGDPVRKLFSESGFSKIKTHRDLAGHERVTAGRFLGAADE